MHRNNQKCRIKNFEFWHFPPIFGLLKMTCLVTLFDCKLQVVKNSPKLTIFCIFNELLSTQNVNVARFARNVSMRLFSVIFKHYAKLFLYYNHFYFLSSFSCALFLFLVGQGLSICTHARLLLLVRGGN